MKCLWLVLIVLLCTGLAAQAQERSPAALLPAEVGLYVDLNLSTLAGNSPDAQALTEAIGLPRLMGIAQEALAQDTKTQAQVAQIFSLVTAAGQSLGWRVGLGLAVNPLEVAAGGQPKVFVVANVADRAALEQALPALLKQLDAPVGPPTTEGDITLRPIEDVPATLAQGKDWIAFVFPAEAVADLTKVVSGADSLASLPDYQQALGRVPKGALLTEYLSGPMLQQAVATASLAMPGAKLPPPPDHGAVTSVSLQVSEVKGQRVVQAVSQADLDLLTFLVQGPVSLIASSAVGEARENSRKTQCLANVKNLALAMNMYVADYDQFPKADRWVTAIQDYVRNDSVFRCPSDDSGAKSSYGMNWGLSAKKTSVVKDAARTVVIYETAHPGDCPRGPKTDIVSPPRHLGGNNFGFVDGHAKWLPAGSEPQQMDW